MKKIKSTSYDGTNRVLYQKTCRCGKDYYVPKHVWRERRYCSVACQAFYSRKRVLVKCASCGRELERSPGKIAGSKSGLQFCDRACKERAQRIEGGIPEIQPDHYKNGNTGYRKRAINHYGAMCMAADCGCTSEVMLDAHHIDGNRKNGDLSNIAILCVWCHALVTRKVYNLEDIL